MSSTLEPLTPDRRRQQTRDHLLAAAAQVFAERGFHGATLDVVAAAAGFSKGAVYSNFKNKEDLFLAILETGYSRELDSLRATLDASEEPAEARLADFLPLIVEGETDLLPPGVWAVLYMEFALFAMRNPVARHKLAEIDDANISAVAELISEGTTGRKDPGAIKREARIVEALFRGISLMRVLDPAAVDEALMEAALSFVTTALTSEA
ncbi:MAG: TetR/AcrR family transcriptional regulator [Acidimicrobiales bacterium]